MRQVIKKRLEVSGMQEIWRDDHSWRTLADELVMALAGKATLLDRETAGRIFADAQQMREIRARFDAYNAARTKEQKKEGGRSRNAYAQWAAENMNGEKKETT